MGSKDQGKNHSFDQPFGGYLAPKDPATASAARNHFVAASGEFVGTFLFLFMAFLGHLMAVDQAGDTGPNGTNSASTVMYISMSYGFSLLVAVWALYRISGGLFNPAVTLAMVVTGSLPPVRGIVLFPAQILSGICAAAVVSAIVPGDIKTVQTTLTPGMSSAQGVFLEMFLTSLLVFTVLMLAAEKSKDTFIAPIGIGLSLFVAEVAGVFYTGASLNPARSFGPCVAGGNFQTYHWIYWIGPFLGALIAGGYYHFVKFFNYEEANPGQDSSGSDDEGRPSSSQSARDGAQPQRDGRDTTGGARNGGGYHPGYAENQA
ncbi:hypothetical protein LTR36_003945 [Oleoguttula mirabilis]|uniref:Aquaporin n=1 Tax=Oleoguttula mirabilis TaxID=1507867 RepID=A0AAV9JIG4_9PEZI|nr:hypothetical protein LTR36_003945 [Oleoguttula mirabilis]